MNTILYNIFVLITVYFEAWHCARIPRAGILTNIRTLDLRQGEILRNTGEVRRGNQCGIRRNMVPDAVIKIVGGTTTTKHEFPWQLSLQWRFNDYTYHVCGSTLLSDRWVVTAAHCTHQFKPSDLVLVAGEHDLKKNEGSEQTREIAQIIEHEGYNTSTQLHDIVLIRVKRPFHIDGLYTLPICLPPIDYLFSGFCVVTGWGKLSENGESADRLQKVVVPIISDHECRKKYQDIGYSGPVAWDMICAGYTNGDQDACQGDSGGPYVCRGPDRRYYLTGIVSWGIGCARPNVPGVYTEVSHYINWMNNAVRTRSLERSDGDYIFSTEEYPTFHNETS